MEAWTAYSTNPVECPQITRLIGIFEILVPVPRCDVNHIIQ